MRVVPQDTLNLPACVLVSVLEGFVFTKDRIMVPVYLGEVAAWNGDHIHSHLIKPGRLGPKCVGGKNLHFSRQAAEKSEEEMSELLNKCIGSMSTCTMREGM